MSSAFDAYVDDAGNPELRQSSVLLWDVLGISAMSKDPQAATHLRALTTALRSARDRAMFEDPDLEVHAVTWFTDNVVVGTPAHDAHGIETALGYTALGVAYMQLIMLDAGFLARGAIAFGPLHMQKDFAFGAALIEASELEKRTKWPRVALTLEAAERNREVVRTAYGGDHESSPQAEEYLVDDDGDVVFVNHLGSWLGEEDDSQTATHNLNRQKQIIESALAREGSGVVFDKWKWLADMHNHVLGGWPVFEQFKINAGGSRHSFHPFSSTL